MFQLTQLNLPLKMSEYHIINESLLKQQNNLQVKAKLDVQREAPLNGT